MTTAITLIILILSVIMHEVAHGYAANSLGDPTARLAGRLTLNPIPHIDLMGSIIIPGLLVLTGSPMLFGWAKPVQYNPYNLRNHRWGEFFVAVAGACTNISLAIIFGLIVRFGSTALATGGSTIFSPTAISLAATIAFINLFLGIFNLIPFPPLDGFTALRSALPWRFSISFAKFEHSIRSMGVISLILFLFIFSFILSGPFFAFVSWIFRFITGV